MITMFIRAIAAGVAVLFGLPVGAQAQPIPLTANSFNQDVIADAGTSGAGVGASFTADMDDGTVKAPGNYTWYAVGQNFSAPVTGLPAGTVFTSGSTGLIYQLRPANAANALFLSSANPTTTNGTLTFAAPSSFGLQSSVSLLTASSHGTGSLTLALLLQGGGSVAVPGTISSPDWLTGSGGSAIAAGGRVDSTGAYGPFVPGAPRLYEELFSVPVDAVGQVVTGISVSWAGSSGDTTTAIFAVSGTSVTVPEPSTQALCGLGLIGAFLRRLRRKTTG